MNFRDVFFHAGYNDVYIHVIFLNALLFPKVGDFDQEVNGFSRRNNIHWGPTLRKLWYSNGSSTLLAIKWLIRGIIIYINKYEWHGKCGTTETLQTKGGKSHKEKLN